MTYDDLRQKVAVLGCGHPDFVAFDAHKYVRIAAILEDYASPKPSMRNHLFGIGMLLDRKPFDDYGVAKWALAEREKARASDD